MNTIALILVALVHFIVTSPGEDASRQVNVNWHSRVSGSWLELTSAADTAFCRAKTIYPQEKLWSLECGDSLFARPRYVCRVNLDGLKRGGDYIYRICAEDWKSATFRFSTADGSRKWKFAAFTDFQPHSNPYTHTLVRMVDSIAGGSPLALCSGDMIDTAVCQDEWEWLLDEPDFMSRFLFASSPGDHEYWGLPVGRHIRQLDEPATYKALFNFPKNGPDGSVGSCWWFIYNRVLFVSLDTGDSNTPVTDRIAAQAEWLVRTAAELKRRYDYLVVMQHKSVQGSYTNDPGVNKRLKPILAKAYVEAGVDLVLSGHDHMYSRTREIDGVWYLDMGSSGSKTRVPDEGQYSDGLHEKIINLRELRQCVGAVVDVDGKQMRVSVYNRDRGLVDRFTVKRR